MSHQISARFVPPRLNLNTPGGNRIALQLPSFQSEITVDSWLYAKLVPSATDDLSINPVTHALTGCTGTVEGIKQNAQKLKYLWVGVEVIDPALASPSSIITVTYDAASDVQLGTFERNLVKKGPGWLEVIGEAGLALPFTGAQLLRLGTENADGNIRIHVLAGFGAA